MVVSPGPIRAPVGGIVPIGGLCIHHQRSGNDDRRLLDDHGCGGDDDRDRQPEPQGDMHAARVGRERQGQGGKPAETHETTGP